MKRVNLNGLYPQGILWLGWLVILSLAVLWRLKNIIVVIVALFSVPKLVRFNQGWLDITTGGREAEAARILNQVTRPTDFVISDSQMFALLADRRAPPSLTDISLVIIRAELQTSERLINISNEYQVAAVAPWALRFPWLPEYLAWVDQNYWVHKVWDNDHSLYFGRKHPPDQPIPNEQQVHLGDKIILFGYSLDTDQIRAETGLPVTLYWKTSQPVDLDYTVFVQVLNDRGELVTQNDSQPIYGYFPTSQWPPDEIIPDRVSIPLPADLPVGQYALIAGMYNLDTLERLPVDDGKDNYVQLTNITVE
jgi:hypothetical protein